MKTVIVSSAIANKPGNGGNAWAVLNWVLGLERLGLKVYFIEQISAGSCVDSAGVQASFDTCENRRYFVDIMERFNLRDTSALLCGEQVHGMTSSELLDLAAEADLLVNISGHLTVEPLKSNMRRAAYIDLDPGFTQFWHADGLPGAHLQGHDSYFTVGSRIGTSGCCIPTGGITWQHILPPVVLEHCRVSTAGNPRRFTTIASWRGAYGPIEHDGARYGVKAHQFRTLMPLPRQTQGTFEIALDIHPGDDKDRAALTAHGWDIVDPKETTPDPWAFHHYVQGSGAECSAAQGVYVDTGSGWFSDRTARYLASGKPALVQETGFSAVLPTGEGLVPFRTLQQAADGATRITRDYAEHCQAARALAERYLDSDAVLSRFLDQASSVHA